MSPKIRNELIPMLSKKVENIVLKHVESAQFFSVIVDTSQDINRKYQLSEIIRN